MTVLALTSADLAARWRFAERLGDWAIGFVVFLGAFVLAEPAPYELVLVPIILVWAACGLKLNRFMLPLFVLLMLYVVGGLVALTQMTDWSAAVTYVAVTAFLAISAIFFAAVIAEAPERRFLVVRRAYIASALVASFIGIAAYFGALPGGDAFLLYGRVKSTFQDPNVFGPFLVMPIALAYQDLLLRRIGKSVWSALILLVLVFAVFLAFSRAAWGMTVLAVLLVTFFTYVTRTRQADRFRIVLYALVGLAIIGILIAVALSIPAVASLFEERAQLVEDYDTGQFGRFGRHILGFFLVQEHPLGLGPSVFGKLFGEDEHNMWLKGFTTYGWLGGFSYIILAVWTLVAVAPLIFKARPWQPVVQCAYAAFIAHIMVHNVIDNDHWRHVFLLYGVLWGAVGAEKLYRRSQDRRRSPRHPLPRAYGPVAVPRAARHAAG